MGDEIMNASTAVATVAFFLALAAAPASAAISNAKSLTAVPAGTLVEKADFAQGHETISGFAARAAESRLAASSAMTQRYFDADLIVTLGALALASGAFVAAGIAGARRRSGAQPVPARVPREGWREDVMQALEADLAQFSLELRKAA
jgi:hypothetical protein